jgi:hypothetical protein
MGAINNYAQNTIFFFIYKLYFKYHDHIHVCILSENYSLAYTGTLCEDILYHVPLPFTNTCLYAPVGAVVFEIAW